MSSFLLMGAKRRVREPERSERVVVANRRRRRDRARERERKPRLRAAATAAHPVSPLDNSAAAGGSSLRPRGGEESSVVVSLWCSRAPRGVRSTVACLLVAGKNSRGVSLGVDYHNGRKERAATE
ncbi:hypothetical protein MTO96_048181 [Rhipicephalus appendiculatus]